MLRDDVFADRTSERNRILVETIQHMVWMAHADGWTYYLSPWGWKYLGIAENTFLGWDWLELIHPDERRQVEEVWRRAVAEKAPYRNEYRVRQETGGYRYFLSQGVPLLGDDGEVRTWVGTWTDIDELKHAKEDRARDASALLLRDRAIQALSPGIVITDPNLPDNPIIYVSPGFERLTGYSAAEALGRNCRFLQGKDSDPEAVGRVRTALAARQPCTVELLNYRKDGATFWNELSLAPVRDEREVLTHFVGVQTDITQRRRLEEQFRQAQKMEAIGQLAGGVAHDFNNLLTVINGYAELVLAGLPAGHALRNPIEQIHLAGERSAGLTRQLLAFSRQQVLAPRVLDLNEVIRDFQKMLLRIIGEDVELNTELAPDLGRVHADPGQMEQILLNLTVNARDAMPLGGQVTIETWNAAPAADAFLVPGEPHSVPGVVIRFTDSGSGIPPEIRARIFEPFFTTKEQGKGTGLGLSVVHGIVSQSGGAIEVSSGPGQGTAFEIWLPRVERTPKAERADRKLRPLVGDETILLVEDDGMLRELLGEVLSNNGYHVFAAAEGAAALEIARSRGEPIDLLLTDVVMPGLGGRQLAEQIVLLHPETRVLFLSGYTTDAVIRHGILKEEVHFLQKPFSAVTLTQKLREVLAC